METAPARADIRRWVARGGAALLGLALGWVLVPDKLSALALSRNDPEGAVAARATSDALAAAGDKALQAKLYAVAEAYGGQSLDRSLFNVVALRVIGLSREARNADDPKAGGYMALAGQLGWRDTPTQLWYVNTASQLGDYEIAMQRADALLRRREFAGDVMAFVRGAAVDPKARASILARLVENPGWRDRLFLDGKTMPEQQKQGLETLIAALRQSSAPVTREEIAPYLDGLIRGGDPGRAWQVWAMAFGGKQSGSQGGNQGVWPRDPDFREAAALSSTAATALPFDWAIEAPAGVTTRFGSAGSLILDIDSRRRGQVAQQFMRLAPGAWHFEAVLDGTVPRADSLLEWTIACHPSRIDVESGPIRTATAGGKTVMSFDFSISPAECASQHLVLAAGSANASSSGSITIDRVAITPR